MGSCRQRSPSNFAIALLGFACWVATPGLAAGQQNSRPAGVDTQQPRRQFDENQVEQQRLKKPPPGLPAVESQGVTGPKIPSFILTHVEVTGARAISESEIAATYAAFLHTRVSTRELEEIAARISNLYRDAGYHLTRAIIPPQDVEHGRVRVRVIEGSISEIQIDGQGVDRFGIRKYFDGLLAEHPSLLSSLERQLLLVNDLPGVRVADTALKEIGQASGKFRLLVKITTWNIYENIGLNNFGSFAVGPLQAYSSTNFNSYLLPGDTVGLNLSTVPDEVKDLKYGRLFYNTPIGASGVRVGGAASYSDVWPDDYRRQTDTHTINNFYEVHASVVPIETRQTSLTFTSALSAIDETEMNLYGTEYSDHIRIFHGWADYKLLDQIGGTNYLTLGLRQGLNGLGASKADDPNTSRTGAKPDFSIFEFFYTRYQSLIDSWSIKASFSGQLASTPLLSSETYYLGGAAFGPGYYNADNGYSGLLELRFDQRTNNEFIRAYQLFGFVDAGQVWDIGFSKQSLVSAGGGIRFELANDFHAEAAVAVPVSYSSRTDEFRGTRILFSISKSLKICPGPNRVTCD